MAESDPAATDSGENHDEKQAEPRTPRSIRFSESEWGRIEREAETRGMTAAELVRHAAVGLVDGQTQLKSHTMLPEIAAQIERMYRGVYLLTTLKREEMIREGQQEELDRIGEDAHESQDSILKRASGPAS